MSRDSNRAMAPKQRLVRGTRGLSCSTAGSKVETPGSGDRFRLLTAAVEWDSLASLFVAVCSTPAGLVVFQPSQADTLDALFAGVSDMARQLGFDKLQLTQGGVVVREVDLI